MTAELVIAGDETRRRFPLAAEYPVHFRKTYFPGRLHGDTDREFGGQSRAAELLGLPPPIGRTPRTFRTCFLPGRPYSRLSPFGAEPEESNLPVARALPLAAAAGLWRLAEEAFSRLAALHEGGLCHGDVELHNLVVTSSPLEVIPIDFEAATFRDVPKKEQKDAEPWEVRVAADFAPLLREAVFLQCALGPQPGPFARMALARIGEALQGPEAVPPGDRAGRRHGRGVRGRRGSPWVAAFHSAPATYSSNEWHISCFKVSGWLNSATPATSAVRGRRDGAASARFGKGILLGVLSGACYPGRAAPSVRRPLQRKT